MNVQNVLTLAIEAIFWAFVGIMMFQFITEVFVTANANSTMISISLPDVIKEFTPVVAEVEIAPQLQTFQQLPDPWELKSDSYDSTNSTVAVILPFPTLRLLPPVKEIKPKSKSATRSKKTEPVAKKKTTKKTEATLTAKRKPGRPRKVA
ncbi:hypothetical protein FNW02_31215 [Komarekiella sp. 'clone 1']|uniref:Uncharacterized protein n=1 Tax=Komarekiella delphini-convector SJRDD-AB1 TaxID=2593771 RepID=A0AA40T3T0_9NOST|nr:hypothetical protein [Komarekiella delphini-convector]MBD6620143.1 hypothetical protein [Komarekiella delphini-convector SJRDD-AB1]